MRYVCPTCSRVFYLDANLKSPCPACGTMLELREESEGDAAGPASQAPNDAAQISRFFENAMAGGGPASQEQQDTYLFGPSTAGGGQSQDVFGGGQPQGPPPAQQEIPSWMKAPMGSPAPAAFQEPPDGDQLTSQMPTAILSRSPFGAQAPVDEGVDIEPSYPPEAPASDALTAMLSTQAGQPLPGLRPLRPLQPLQPQQEDEPMSPEEAANFLGGTMGRSAPTLPVATFPASARMPAARGPSATSVMVITLLVVTALGGTVAALIYLGVIKPPAAISTSATASSAMEDLTQEKRRLTEENATVKKALEAAKSNEAGLKEQIAGLSRDGDALRGAMQKRSEAARSAFDALQLVERGVAPLATLKLADAAVELDHGFPAGHRVRGMALAVLGRADEAVAAFEEADRAAGEAGDGASLLAAGEVCLEVGDAGRALGFYERAAKVEGASARGLVAAARVLLLKGELDPAAESARKARETAAPPTDALAALVLGEALMGKAAGGDEKEREKLLESAVASLEEAVDLNPSSPRASRLCGWVYLERAKQRKRMFRVPDWGRARAHLTRAKALSPGRVDVHTAMAQLMLLGNSTADFSLAETSASEAVRITKGKDAGALVLLAEAQARTGQPGKAVETLKSAVSIDPGNDKLRDLLKEYSADAKALQP